MSNSKWFQTESKVFSLSSIGYLPSNTTERSQRLTAWGRGSGIHAQDSHGRSWMLGEYRNIALIPFQSPYNIAYCAWSRDFPHNNIFSSHYTGNISSLSPRADCLESSGLFGQYQSWAGDGDWCVSYMIPAHCPALSIHQPPGILPEISAWKSSIWRFVITEKAPTRAFSWLKAATTAFTFKTLLSKDNRIGH